MAISINATPVGTSEVKAQRHFSIRLSDRLAIRFNLKLGTDKRQTNPFRFRNEFLNCLQKHTLSLRKNNVEKKF